MIALRKHSNTALAYFLLAALLGIFLRLFFVLPLPANFRYVVHAHSHIALLGWVYLGLSTLIYKLYFSEAGKKKTYLRIYWFTQVSLLGMLFTFPFMGYALYSIIFSTLFLIASYFFAWFVLKKIPKHYKSTYSFRCIRAAAWYMVFSSIGPWALGGIMASLGKTSIWYKMAIYFYLHFQYNAWFIFALIGILLYFFEQRKLILPKRLFDSFFYLLNAGVILSFFLSVLWVEPHWIFYVLAGLGAILQVWAFYQFYRLFERPWKKIPFSGFTKLLLKISFILLIGKVLLQLLTALPYFAKMAFMYTDFVIGYLHWTFLGLVSICLFALLQHAQLLKLPKAVFWLYFSGFVLSEGLIFYKGTATWLEWPFLPNYFKLLTGLSSLIPLSLLILLVINLLRKKQSSIN